MTEGGGAVQWGDDTYHQWHFTPPFPDDKERRWFGFGWGTKWPIKSNSLIVHYLELVEGLQKHS